MLDPLSSWKTRLLAMPDVDTPNAGAWNLANFCGDMMDKVEANGGTVGIFTFDRSLFVSTLLSMGFNPTGGIDWANRLATAWETASGSNTIAASTVTDSKWEGSGLKDKVTKPSGSATIITLSAAKSVVESGLTNVGMPFVNNTVANASQADSLAEQFAKAFRDGTLAFNFRCIGLDEDMLELPKVFSAQ